jgi:regulator of sigma E protease
MAEILNWVYVIATVILMFGAAVFVHEFGHYWMARRRGMKVEAFAIGFGPKIMSWTRDGIEYSWRWIPAGGFVKLPQMMTSDALEGSPTTRIVAEAAADQRQAPQASQDPTPDAAAENIPPAPPGSKILVAFMGPMMNVVFAFAIATLIYYVGLPEPVNPPIIGYVTPNSEEAKLGIREGDRVLSVNGRSVKSWHEVQTTAIMARTNVLPVVIERDRQQITYQLTAVLNETFGLKMLNLDPRDHPVVRSIESGSPADKAGLKVDDEFLSFAGVPIYNQEQLVDLIRKRGGQETEVSIRRNEQRLALRVTPLVDPATKRGRIGVGITPSGKIIYEVQRPGPPPWDQLAKVWNQTMDVLSALFHSKQTGVGAKDLSGPVGILSMLAIQVNEDFRLALSFLVLLNVNLAIINLFPFPVLDGGHILLAIIEKIRRRPLSTRVVEYTSTAFAVLLISFMLYVTFFDLKRWSVFRSMFKQSSQVEQSGKAPPSQQPAPAPTVP